MKIIESTLSAFASQATQWWQENGSELQARYTFFRNLGQKDYLAQISWEDIQAIGEYLPAFKQNPMIRQRALSQPLHPIRHYRTAFIQLVDERNPVAERIDHFISQIKYINIGIVGELLPLLLPDVYIIMNPTTQRAAHYLGIHWEVASKRPGIQFEAFNEALIPLLTSYQEYVGEEGVSETTLRFEIGAFLNFVAKPLHDQPLPQASHSQPQPGIWKFSPSSRNAWELFYQRGFMALENTETDAGDLNRYEKATLLADAVGLKPQSGQVQRMLQFRDAELGDIVVAHSGKREILGIGVLTSGYAYDIHRKPYPHMRKVDWVITQPVVLDATFFSSHHFARFSYWPAIRELYREKYPELSATLFELEAEPLAVAEDDEKYLYPAYTSKEALRELFVDELEFERIQQMLKNKKNLILQGPPGVGKTFVSKKLAYTMMGYQDHSKVEMIQFHPAYTYEDFIQGIRPTTDGNFKRADGIFYSFCKKAHQDPHHAYFFIIDEINRGNVSSILGELFMLIEPDKREPQYAIPLTYAYQGEEKFFIPPNLYILATMNTADRSLAIVDYALRRRFAFIDLVPEYGEKFQQHLRKQGVSDELIKIIVSRMTALNQEILSEPVLGSGFRVGHSYFCNPCLNISEKLWYEQIISYEIGPLIREYWYDDPAFADRRINQLLAN